MVADTLSGALTFSKVEKVTLPGGLSGTPEMISGMLFPKQGVDMAADSLPTPPKSGGTSRGR